MYDGISSPKAAVKRRDKISNKYFELKTRGAAAPTQITCCLQSQVRTRQHVRAMQQHMLIQHGYTDTDRLCMPFPFFESLLIWSCTKQSG